jgi:DHA2 family multidrug resistance protein
VGNASGIFNFVRNVGGSVGISAANTIAQRHLQTHRNDIVHWLSGGNWIFRREIQMLSMQMHLHAGPRLAVRRAFYLTQQSLDNQAQLWAYVDIFRYLAFICAICVPIAFILKKSSPSGGAA